MLKELEAAFQEGMALHKQGKSAEGLAHLERAAALAPKVFGPDHVHVGSICATAGQVACSAGRWADAERLLQRGLAVHERIPTNDLRVANVLSDLSVAQDELGKHGDAEKNVKRALAIQEAMTPRNDVAIALTLNNYGVLLTRLGRFAEAESLFKRCVELRENKLGKDHDAVIDALHNLGGAYRQMRRDKEAEALALRTLEMRKSKFGPDHIAVSQSLTELGLIAFNTGRILESEKHYLEALRIREKVFGKDDPGNATLLQNLALAYAGFGRPGEAEKLYRRSLAMSEARFGPDHPQVANTLSNVSTLYVYLGRFDEAEKALLRSIKIYEDKAPQHPLLAAGFVNLAALYQTQGRLKEAQVLLGRALASTETRFGKDHIEVSVILNNLAIVHRNLNQPATSLALLERALKIQEGHYGANHAATSTVHNNIAVAYWGLGRFADADQRLARSDELLRGKARSEQEHRGTGLHSRAELNQAMGRTREALRFETESLNDYLTQINNVVGFSSEAHMYDFVEIGSHRLPSLVNMVLQTKDEDAAALAYDWTLRLKGVVFDTLCRYRRAQQLLPKDAAVQERVARYRRQKEFLASLALNPPTGKDAPRLEREKAEAQREVAKLEEELTRFVASQVPDVVARRDTLTTETLRKRLPADGALIEFLRISIRDFKAPSWGEAHYVAFVLTPGLEAPRLIDLGPAKEIDAGVELLRKEFGDFQEKLRECESADEINALEKSQEKQFAARSAAVHARLFAPLRQALGKATLLFLAPDGALNRLPFETLVGPDGKYLIEHYRCAYLSCGRDLLREPAKLAKGTVIFANPDFKLDAEERLARAEKLVPKKAQMAATRGQPAPGLRSVGWKNLPGAAAEAKDIQKNLSEGTYGPVQSYVGAEALEEVLKAMPAPRVLHLATHGYFLDREPDAKEPERNGVGAGWARGQLRRMDNPLLRSGIVLAGANTIGESDAKTRVDDGWVTAEEVALLNLHGTELVVLSACQTGLGDIKSGEGVQGLRRAFLYAGAQTLLTSLFEVPDQETRVLMNRFYANLKSGQGKLRAMHSAQRGFIADRRKSSGAAHPFFWASFVLVGNPN